MASTKPQTVRVVAGTRAAIPLAEALAVQFSDRLRVAVTLAGTRRVPRVVGCTVDRMGDADPGDAVAVIDALDPFDRRAVRALREAARRAGLPRLAFRPPMWERHPLDRWVEVRNLMGAVDAVASVARIALLALPPDQISAFQPIGGLRFPVRLEQVPPGWNLPPRFAVQLGSANRSLAGEIRLLQRTKAQAVVMRATGTAEEAPTMIAARTLDLPIIMIRRPRERGNPPAQSRDAALEWVSVVLGDAARVRGATAWR